MDEVLGSRFLIAALISKELTRDISFNLDYDYEAAYADINSSIRDYYRGMTLDRRTIAIGADGHMLSYELFDQPQIGWKQVLYMSTDYFPLMFANVKKPKNALINGPDKHFNLIAYLHSIDCKLTFPNNKFLNTFEKFVLNSSEYSFDVEYEVIEQEDIYNYSGQKFDLMSLSGNYLVLDEELINAHIDALEVDGVMHVIDTNDNMQIYNENYESQPSYKIFEVLDNYSNITSYHIPFGIGHNFIMKNEI